MLHPCIEGPTQGDFIENRNYPTNQKKRIAKNGSIVPLNFQPYQGQMRSATVGHFIFIWHVCCKMLLLGLLLLSINPTNYYKLRNFLVCASQPGAAYDNTTTSSTTKIKLQLTNTPNLP